MQTQGAPIKQWQRPAQDLMTATSSEPQPQTLLRVYPGMGNAYFTYNQDWVAKWLAAGNNIVVLGVNAGLTEAPFVNRVASDQGEVVIKTRQRHTPDTKNPSLLEDNFGAVVWIQNPTSGASDNRSNDDGQVFVAVTPHLAANAYQDAPGNYAFLANLVQRTPGTIWVDEYIHGYKLPDVVETEEIRSWEAYLAQTPIKVGVMQGLLMLGIFLLSQNRRLGNLTRLLTPPVDNSLVYIEALAAVLHKAKSTSFLVNMITKAERTSLQKSLGLAETDVEDSTLTNAWVQQTGRSPDVLIPLLYPPNTSADKQVLSWLAQLQQIRQVPIR
jgi:hypothetical protein